MKTNAYEVMSPEKSERIRRECPEKIVKSRFALTEKNTLKAPRLMGSCFEKKEVIAPRQRHDM